MISEVLDQFAKLTADKDNMKFMKFDKVLVHNWFKDGELEAEIEE